MSYNLSANQNVYIELTHFTHGGEGWDLGEVLWSPAKKNWAILGEVKPGDLIIHSVKRGGKNHRFAGVSLVRNSCQTVCTKPPKPSIWDGHDSYYRVPLQSFSPFDTNPFVQDFLSQYWDQLFALNENHPFYTKDAKPAQKYLVKVSKSVFNLILQFLTQNGIALFDNILVANEDDTEDTPFGVPTTQRVVTSVSRIIRDTKVIKALKEEHENRCQICGHRIVLQNGNAYSEGHHLKKLGGLHQGPDVKENIIILCPNHHTEFDYGLIGIDEHGKIVHIDPENQFNGKSLCYSRNDLDIKYLKYYMRYIFNQPS